MDDPHDTPGGDWASRVSEILATHYVAWLRCGYNLRGLEPGGRCPECGTPVDHAVAPPLLEGLDPRWVRRAGRGATLVGAGIMVWIGTLFLVAIGAGAVYVTVNTVRFMGWPRSVFIGEVVFGVGIGVGMILTFVGTVMVSMREVELSRVASVEIWRRGVHLALTILVVAIPVGAVGLPVVRLVGLPSRTFTLLVDLWLLVLAFGSIVVLAVLVGYLRQLLVRVPDAMLGRKCTARVVMMLGFVFLLIAGFELANTLLIRLGRPAEVMDWIVAVVGGIGTAYSAAWLGVGIAACGRRFARCAARARGRVDPSSDGP